MKESDYRYNNDNLFIKKSNTHGFGLFTKTKIPKNTKIVACRYAVIPKSVFADNGLVYNKDEIEFMTFKNMLSIKEYTCVLPIYNDIYVILLGVTSFINNSVLESKANVSAHLPENYDINSELFLYSIKDIDPGEELLAFYNLQENDKRFKSNFI